MTLKEPTQAHSHNSHHGHRILSSGLSHSLGHAKLSSTKQPSPINDTLPSVKLEIELESPPAVLYGAATESTGSIISGLLFMKTNEKTDQSNNVELEYVTLSLVQTIQLSKPFLIQSNTVHSCKDCNVRKNVLARWDVVTAKTSFVPGSHAYPFSHLIPGSLPASSKLGSKTSATFVKYEIMAVAKVHNAEEEVKVVLPLNITRSILKGPDRNSLRVFPPTEVSATALLPSVVYPKSVFPVELRLENMNNQTGDRRWRMRKLSWRVEETTKIRAFVCEKHKPKLKVVEDHHKKTKPAPKTNKSNVHYSTVQTSVSLSPDNVTDETRTANQAPDATGINGAPIINVDTTEFDQTAPSHAVENFVHDFVGNGPASTAVSASNSAATTSPTGTESPGSTPRGTPRGTPQGTPKQDDLHVYITEARTVSHGEIKAGWKSDYSSRGKIELVADINCMNLSTGLIRPGNKASSEDSPRNEPLEGLRHGANLSCDIEDPNEGIFVTHMLVIEVVIAEETISYKKTKPKAKKTAGLEPVASHSSLASLESNEGQSQQAIGTPTGAARVLRMQFKLSVTERSGLGISWDDEVPPTYDDVSTLSPPTYNESSGNNTPQTTPLSTPQYTRTPGILYGVGRTPGMSLAPSEASIDGVIDDSIQDLAI